MPAKLDRCVADVKGEGGVDNPWAVCNASIGKEKKTQEKINANRQVPFFNPDIKKKKVEPTPDKSPKGKIGGTKNMMTTNMWKQIYDSQLKRNVKEPKE